MHTHTHEHETHTQRHDNFAFRSKQPHAHNPIKQGLRCASSHGEKLLLDLMGERLNLLMQNTYLHA